MGTTGLLVAPLRMLVALGRVCLRFGPAVSFALVLRAIAALPVFVASCVLVDHNVSALSCWSKTLPAAANQEGVSPLS